MLRPLPEKRKNKQKERHLPLDGCLLACLLCMTHAFSLSPGKPTMLYVALIIPDRLFFFLAGIIIPSRTPFLYCKRHNCRISPVVIAENDLRCDAYHDLLGASLEFPRPRSWGHA